MSVVIASEGGLTRGPEFASKCDEVTDEKLFWEPIKMETRAETITYFKGKDEKKRDEENC